MYLRVCIIVHTRPAKPENPPCLSPLLWRNASRSDWSPIRSPDARLTPPRRTTGRTLAKMHLRHLNGWTNSEKKKRIPLKIESGCQKGREFILMDHAREKLELVTRPVIAPQKPLSTGHVPDSVYSGWSLRREDGSDRLFIELGVSYCYSLLRDKYRFQEPSVFAMIQVLPGLLAVAIQASAGCWRRKVGSQGSTPTLIKPLDPPVTWAVPVYPMQYVEKVNS